MKSARALLEEFTAASFRDPKKAAEMFTETWRLRDIDTPEQVFAEYEFTARSSKTGRTIHELFFGRLVAENGRIKLLRESVNLVELALGVFPNGLADYKAPSEHTA